MKIKFIDASELKPMAKATVHQTGKIGFSSECVDYMGLTEEKSIAIGINEENGEDENLYAVLKEGNQAGSFKIQKAGEYFYVNAKLLFQKLNVNYKDNKIIYDISKLENEEQDIFKFSKRIIIKKNNGKPTELN